MFQTAVVDKTKLTF